MSFKPNDKVVCINDDWGNVLLWAVPYQVQPSTFPVKGTVYVVRDTALSVDTGNPVIALVGIISPINRIGREMMFPAKRFRPVSEVGHPQVNTDEVPHHIDNLD